VYTAIPKEIGQVLRNPINYDKANLEDRQKPIGEIITTFPKKAHVTQVAKLYMTDNSYLMNIILLNQAESAVGLSKYPTLPSAS
jgi:hypothetical protein